jgi:hypothetical protein
MLVPGYSPGICWHLNPPPIEFTNARDKLTPDYWSGIYQQLKVPAITAGTKCARAVCSCRQLSSPMGLSEGYLLGSLRPL